jgi:CRP-like cAMP-binding protein
MVSVEDLKISSFFNDLQDSYLAKIVKLCQEETFQAEDVIIDEGDKAKKIYVLMEGTIAIQISLKKYQHVVVNTAEEKGELFGWSALVEPKRYSASVKCLKEVRALSINGEELEKLFEEDPVMGLTFMKKIASLIDNRLNAVRTRLVSSIS